MNKKIYDITRISIVAALYVVLTVLNPFSYDKIQFRISEVLVFLCFYRKDYSIGLIIGCLIANVFSPFQLYDIVFGTSATIISVLLISISKNKVIASIYPIVFNALLVGLELTIIDKTPFIFNLLWVGLGEVVVIALGLIVVSVLENRPSFYNIIQANQNIKKVTSK